VWNVDSGEVVRRFHAAGDGVGYGDVSRDGRTVAIPSYDRLTRLYDLETGTLQGTLGPHANTVWWVAFSPDGHVLATASWDKVVKLWDVASGRAIATLVHTGPVDRLAWNDDGTLLASGARDGIARLWTRDGRPIGSLTCGGRVQRMQFSHDSRRIAVACGDSTVVFDVDVGRPLFRKQSTGSDVFVAKFLDDGDVISVEGDGTARRWTPEATSRFLAREHTSGITRLDHCSASTLLTVSEDHTAKRWTRDGQVTWRSPPSWVVTDAVCSRRADLMYVAVKGELWKIAAGAEPVRIALDKPIPGAAIVGMSPDDARLAVVDVDDRAALVTLAEGRTIAGGVASFKRTWEPKLSWAADGSAFAIMSDAGAVVWDGVTGKLRFEVPPPGGLVRRIVLDSTHDTLFVSSMSPGLHRYRLSDGKELAPFTNAGFAWGMTVIGPNLFVGYDHGGVVEYEIASGKELRVLAQFGAYVYTIEDAGRGFLWVGTGKLALSLLDRESRAIVYRAPLPTEPMLLAADPDLGATIGGLSGMLAFVRTGIVPVDGARLDLEARCHVAQALVNGAIVPHAPELDVCARLEHPR
jgi:WD40 repeat protein